MDIAMKWNKVCGTVPSIPSKSDAHRALISASLSNKPTHFHLSSFSNDIRATLSCLSALGANIEFQDNGLTLFPIADRKVSPILDCGESGSTLRFLLPVAAAVSQRPKFIGKGRLPFRPLGPLVDAMEKNGCSFSRNSVPLEIFGEPRGGEYVLPGDISSQFVSGLLFALPLLDSDSIIHLSSPLQSSAYVDMTLDTLKKFGIEITGNGSSFFIKGNQKYTSPGEYTIDGDWSNAAPFFASAALTGEISLTGLNFHSHQSDIEILSIIKKFGGNICQKKETVHISSEKKKPLSLDVSQFPDLFPVIAILLCGAEGKSVLFNAKRLRIKESDRIASTLSLIQSLGGKAESDDDSLTIYGTGRLKGGKCDSFSDHRIVMAAAVASTISEEEVIISNSEAVSKSYADFFEHFKIAGGTYRVI